MPANDFYPIIRHERNTVVNNAFSLENGFTRMFNHHTVYIIRSVDSSRRATSINVYILCTIFSYNVMFPNG